MVDVSPTDTPMSCTFVANTTALKGIFQRLATQFGAMYKRKAFLHWYKGEGKFCFCFSPPYLATFVK